MLEILEGIVPYLYFLVSCFILALGWCLWTNRRFISLLFRRHKTIKRFKGKGKEVIFGPVLITADNITFYIQFGRYKYRLLDAVVYGRWGLGETKCIMQMEDELLKAVCFSENNLYDWYHEQLMKHARAVFIPAIGVQIIWTILLKMLENLKGM